LARVPDGGEAMGKGDRRSKRGKIWRGTFGKTRPKKKKAKHDKTSK
jgi:30S ribosomal protein S31